MSNVQALLNSLSDADLKEALAEIKKREFDGVLPNPKGNLSTLQQRLQATGMSVSEARHAAEFEICLKAAFKWATLDR